MEELCGMLINWQIGTVVLLLPFLAAPLTLVPVFDRVPVFFLVAFTFLIAVLPTVYLTQTGFFAPEECVPH